MEDNQIPPSVPSLEEFIQTISNWPMQTQIGLLVAAIIWLVGGNLLVYKSMKRRRIPYWKSLLPTRSGFNAVFGLSKKEWFILFMLAVTSLSFGTWGIAGAH